MSFASVTQGMAWWVGRREGLEPETSQWKMEAAPSTARLMSEIPDLISEGTKRSGECRNLGPAYPLRQSGTFRARK